MRDSRDVARRALDATDCVEMSETDAWDAYSFFNEKKRKKETCERGVEVRPRQMVIGKDAS